MCLGDWGEWSGLCSDQVSFFGAGWLGGAGLNLLVNKRLMTHKIGWRLSVKMLGQVFCLSLNLCVKTPFLFEYAC